MFARVFYMKQFLRILMSLIEVSLLEDVDKRHLNVQLLISRHTISKPQRKNRISHKKALGGGAN